MSAPRPRPSLHPTLWRTARVLAHGGRLCLLEAVLRRPGMTVTQLADATGLALPAASMHLRALHARGLLRAERSGSRVRYRAAADPDIRFAAPLLAAFRRALLVAGRSPGDIVRVATGFTHPRRLAVWRRLCAGPAGVAELSRSTRIGRRALHRHLDKLVRHGLVETTPGGYRPVSPPDPLAAAFIKAL